MVVSAAGQKKTFFFNTRVEVGPPRHDAGIRWIKAVRRAENIGIGAAKAKLDSLIGAPSYDYEKQDYLRSAPTAETVVIECADPAATAIFVEEIEATGASARVL